MNLWTIATFVSYIHCHRNYAVRMMNCERTDHGQLSINHHSFLWMLEIFRFHTVDERPNPLFLLLENIFLNFLFHKIQLNDGVILAANNNWQWTARRLLLKSICMTRSWILDKWIQSVLLTSIHSYFLSHHDHETWWHQSHALSKMSYRTAC